MHTIHAYVCYIVELTYLEVCSWTRSTSKTLVCILSSKFSANMLFSVLQLVSFSSFSTNTAWANFQRCHLMTKLHHQQFLLQHPRQIKQQQQQQQQRRQQPCRKQQLL